MKKKIYSLVLKPWSFIFLNIVIFRLEIPLLFRKRVRKKIQLKRQNFFKEEKKSCMKTKCFFILKGSRFDSKLSHAGF